MIILKAERLNSVQEYYFSRKLEEIRKMDASGEKVINLGIGSPDLAPSNSTIEALVESAKNEKHHAYQPYRSVKPLREAFAEWYHRVYKVNLNPESDVLPLLGSKEGILYISMAFLNPGDEVLVPNPGYPAYAAATNLIGAKVRYYDLTEEKNWHPDLEALSHEDLSKVKLMWVNYPHMPTGAHGGEALFKSLIEFGQKYQILICNDNPYSLVLNPKAVSILNFDPEKSCCIELNSLSKSFNMAGWRVGMLAGGKDYVDAVLQVKSNVDSGMFLPVQHAAIEALNNPENWHDERNKIYAERRKLAWQILDHLGCTYNQDQVGMFVWAKAPADVDNVEGFLDKILREARVFLTPGKVFGSNGEQYIRLSLCSSREILEEAYKRIQTTIKTIQPCT